VHARVEHLLADDDLGVRRTPRRSVRLVAGLPVVDVVGCGPRAVEVVADDAASGSSAFLRVDDRQRLVVDVDQLERVRAL
jgi:hypothetical protein